MPETIPAILRQLEIDGFVAKGQESAGQDERSLFSAVRRAHGMLPDNADVCYRNWLELRVHLRNVWSALDAEATHRYGRRIQAHVWALLHERTPREVSELVAAAQSRFIGGELLIALPRPTMSKVPASDKCRGSLCITVELVRQMRGVSSAEVLADAVEGTSTGSSDEDVLRWLDSMVPDEHDQEPEPTEIPRALSRYYGVQLSLAGTDSPPVTFRQMANEMLGHWSSTPTDDQLLAWILERAPETTRRSVKTTGGKGSPVSKD